MDPDHPVGARRLPSKLRIKIRIALAVIGVIIGVSVCVVFALKFKNLSAAIWAIISGITAAIVLFVHIQYVREYWRTYHKALQYLMLLGCFLMMASICGFTTYLTLALVEKRKFSVYGTNYFIVIVWCFMTFKWSLGLFYYSRSYRNIFCPTKREELVTTATVPYSSVEE